jgi:GNAT superfamily N-acetyltransferase
MKCAPHKTISLADGSTLAVRPISTDDRAGLADAFARMSEQSRYRRFMGPKPKLSERELRYFTEVDHRTHEALVAVVPETGAIAGEARYAIGGDASSADVAVMVVDEWQGRGLGPALLCRLVAAARAAGLARLTADSIATNRPARSIVNAVGFELRAVHAGAAEFELPLAAAA